MAATPKTVEELAPIIGDLLRQHFRERPRLDDLANWVAGRVNDIYVPRKATSEYRMLVDQSRFNVLPLVETTVAQALYVDGFRPTGPDGRAPDRTNTKVWDQVWQPNRMDSRQASLWRPAIRYGYSYALVFPGNPRTVGDATVRTPTITPYSPRQLTAIYGDPVNDEWPTAAMVVPRRIGGTDLVTTYADPVTSAPSVDPNTKITVYDKNFRYKIVRGTKGWNLVGDAELHGLDVVPVVRFTDETPNDDSPVTPASGKIHPLLPVQRQLNQISFGLAMALHYGAFRQRWATGMTIEVDANGNDVVPYNVGVDTILQNEAPDGKFGEFQQTDLKGYLDARTAALLYITSVAQIPPHNMVTGSGISNLSADALVALEAAHGHDVEEHQSTFGEQIEQLLRLSGLAMGDMEAWNDFSAQVSWRDTTPRSMAQTADALGKLAIMLEVPVEALWELIPGVTTQDLARWKEMRARDDMIARLEAMANEPVPEPPGPGPGPDAAATLAAAVVT